MGKRHKGFVSLDFLFSIIPILLIVSSTIFVASGLQEAAKAQLERQVLFDKLVTASTYVVRIGAADSEGAGFPEKAIHPNLILRSDFSDLEKQLKERLKLGSLDIGFQGVQAEMCIYRLVIYKPTGELKKLYFCGG